MGNAAEAKRAYLMFRGVTVDRDVHEYSMWNPQQKSQGRYLSLILRSARKRIL